MYNRKIKLIRALLGHERMSSAELMDKLDISQRTLRNEVKEINEILRQENVGIYSSNTGGYYLKAEEKQKENGKGHYILIGLVIGIPLLMVVAALLLLSLIHI